MAKVLVSLADDLLRRIDRLARSRRMSRSAYLSELAERDLARAAGPGAASSARRALSQLDRALARTPVEDSTAVVRGERDAR
jgi:predicted transcriptional regulator